MYPPRHFQGVGPQLSASKKDSAIETIKSVFFFGGGSGSSRELRLNPNYRSERATAQASTTLRGSHPRLPSSLSRDGAALWTSLQKDPYAVPGLQR